MADILIVEDELRVSGLLDKGLSECGHTVKTAADITSAMMCFTSHEFDIIVCDVILPDGSGFDFCRDVRIMDSDIPIIMLTALGTIDHKLSGFDSGADDYMVKPFDFRELNARINVLLKRKKDKIALSDELVYSDLKINVHTGNVSRGDISITLTPKEYNLLLFFMRNPERVLSRSEIAEKVWDTHFDTGTNFIDVYINYLRKKIDKNFDQKLIHTRPGMGFVLSDRL